MLTVGITTFKERYEKFFIPLINCIREIDNEIEIIVAINGNNKETFDQEFRKKILYFLSEKNNVYPVFFPEFRGLSKLWNTILVHSTNDIVFMCNDDIYIQNNEIFKIIKDIVINYKFSSFKINTSWSHIVLDRNEVDMLGWFDERFLGIGDEDDDFEWRYEKNFGNRIKNVKIPGIINYQDREYIPSVSQETCDGKYSLFNRSFMLHHKYEINPAGQKKGICEQPLIEKLPNLKQYPYEYFFKVNKNSI